MKLSALAVPETATFELKHPQNNAPLGVTIHFHTPDSAKYAALEKKYAKPSKQKQSIIIGKKGEANKIEIDPEDAEIREKVLVAAVFQIDGAEDMDLGSPAAIRGFLTNPSYGWALEQYAEYSSERSNYFLLSMND